MNGKLMYRAVVIVLAVFLAVGLCGCKSSGKNVDSSSQYVSKPEKIVSEIEKKCSLPQMQQLNEEQVFTEYGIEKKYFAYYSAIVAADSISKDEVVIFEAMDEGEANTIRDRLQEHYDAVLRECEEYLPDEYEVVKKCSVVKDGIFVRLFISADADKMNEIYKSYF